MTATDPNIPTRRRSRKREALLTTAVNLFHKEGYHAVGIDRILAEARVSKPTLYAHFSSKDELIVAALRQRDAQARERFRAGLRGHADNPRQQLLAIFDMLESWVQNPEFTGCLFINASAEFASHDDPIHRAAAEHKTAYREIIAELAEQAGAESPQLLAEQLMLLVDGLIVTSQVQRNSLAVEAAKQTARLLLDQALGPAAGE